MQRIFWLGVAVGVLVAGLAAPAPARAQEPQDAQDCPDAWFPDIRCGRSGRPAGFEQPMVQPYLFEDPFVTTNLTGVFMWQEFPQSSALQGGELFAAAVQARVALTDRIALIATKDGRVWSRPDNSLIRHQDGWMNLAAGLKYAWIQDRERNLFVSPMLRLEVSTGSSDILEGGSGYQFLPSVAAAWGREDLHLIGDLGARIPTDGGSYTTNLFYHLYADYQVAERFQPFAQLSGIHYIDDGDGKRKVKSLRGAPDLPLNVVQQATGSGPFEGGDLQNFGSRGVDGNDVLTAALGFHVPINPHLTFSLAYQRPITSRKDLLKQRVTAALRWEY
ncbi:MAG: hypothetical protein ABFS46_06795 [Myxococcota bacterium]